MWLPLIACLINEKTPLVEYVDCFDISENLKMKHDVINDSGGDAQ